MTHGQYDSPPPLAHWSALRLSQSLKPGEVGFRDFDANTLVADEGAVDHVSTEAGKTAAAMTLLRESVLTFSGGRNSRVLA